MMLGIIVCKPPIDKIWSKIEATLKGDGKIKSLLFLVFLKKICQIIEGFDRGSIELESMVEIVRCW